MVLNQQSLEFTDHLQYSTMTYTIFLERIWSNELFISVSKHWYDTIDIRVQNLAWSFTNYLKYSKNHCKTNIQPNIIK